MRFDDRIPLYVSIPIEEADKIMSICHDKDISISDYITNVLKEHGRKKRLCYKQIVGRDELIDAVLPDELIAKDMQERVMHKLMKGLCEVGAFTFRSEDDRMRNQIVYTGQIDVIIPEKENALEWPLKAVKED